MNKIKILYLGNVLSKHGTTPTTIETLSERFRADFEVATASSIKNKLLRLLDMWMHIANHRHSVSAVLVDTYSSSAFLFAWTSGRLCKILGVPYIAFLHGGDLPKRFANNPKVSKHYLTHAKAIVSPSGYLQDAVQRNFGLEAVIIPNYIDLQLYPFLHRQQFTAVKMLWVRSFHATYNPTLAIQILSLLNKQGTETSLTMVGPDKDGSAEECLQLAEALGMAEKLTITGRLPKEDWIALSASHNLFLNTTTVDNTPVSVMEAMALGMPVVTTKVGGIPFLFADGVEGMMVAEQKPEAMVDAIESLIHSAEKTAAISAAARKKAEQWDWEVVRLKWLELLRTNES